MKSSSEISSPRIATVEAITPLTEQSYSIGFTALSYTSIKNLTQTSKTKLGCIKTALGFFLFKTIERY